MGYQKTMDRGPRIADHAPWTLAYSAGVFFTILFTHNLKVRGSNPLPATNTLILLNFMLNIFVDSSLFYDFL